MLTIRTRTSNKAIHFFILLDGASFDNMGYVYNPADTMVANMFNELINTNVNYCYLHENAANSVYFVDMVLYKSEPVLKSQYVLYPVPVMATTTTIKATHKVHIDFTITSMNVLTIG